MILLFPYQQLVFESPLSQEEVIQRLTCEVAKLRSGWQWVEKRTEKFEGTVSEEGFQISRIIRYRNSFLPLIQGRFSPLGQGVRIEVTMKLHLIMVIFSLIWLSFFGLPALGIALQILTTGRVEAAGIIPCAMMIFFYLMVTIGFGIEAHKARKLLSRIFEVDDARAKQA